MTALIRARLLIAQHRWQLAENDLRQLLMAESQDAEAHRLLAICLLGQNKFAEAEEAARIAIHLAPDDAATHESLGLVLFQRRQFAAAMTAANEAIRIDPERAYAYELLSQLWQVQGNWPKMLEAADRGLELNPDDVDCNNLRAIALVKLGRRVEAGQTIGATLARNPDNSTTHANQGWTLLEAGKPREAMTHFREALRLDPTNDWARQGIVEALKAKNHVYRLLLGYFLYMARLSGQKQWLLIIGFYVFQRFINGVADDHPEAAPYLNPIIYAYVAFAITTWIGDSLFNLLLFCDKTGRLALSQRERRGAQTVGSLLMAALLLFAGYWFTSDEYLMLSALFIALLTLPVAGTFACAAGWPRWTMIGVVALLGSVAVSPLIFDGFDRGGFMPGHVAKNLMIHSILPYSYGILASQFLVMTLARIIPTR